MKEGGIFQFGEFQVDALARTLRRNEETVMLTRRAFEVLLYLVQNPGRVISRDELLKNVWPDTFVDENSLAQSISALRRALDEKPGDNNYIATLPGRGYQFVSPVKLTASEDLATVPYRSAADGAASGGILLTRETTRTRITQESEFPSLPAGGAALPAVEGRALQATDPRRVTNSTRRWRALWLLVPLAILLLALTWRRSAHEAKQAIPATAVKVIAVLPFSNQGAGPDLEYLRYAIANELVTDLSHVRTVTVRPFASTSRFASQPVDPVTVGKQLQATYILAGGYLLEKQNLHINLELVDVARNEPTWRDELVVSEGELVALRNQLADKTTKGLLPSIKVAGSSVMEMPTPRSERAFNLYLHSIGISHDPELNLVAIRNLEESVSIDSQYAPAWGELSMRYYLDYAYRKGGGNSLTKALDASTRESDLDPAGTGNTVVMRSELGQLSDAYDDAARLLRRRSDSSLAHFEMSYVLRYAGLLGEAEKECDAALAIDPGYWGFRSCAIPFILDGKYAEADRYMRLDENTSFVHSLRMDTDLRQGATAAATLVASEGGRDEVEPEYGQLIHIFLSHGRQSELNAVAANMENRLTSSGMPPDGEGFYRNAAVLAYCGKSEAALRILRKAIQGNYCSYPAMDHDPLLNSIRQKPEFAELRKGGEECHENFLAHRRAFDAALQ
jgi:DNA-binding winged helix-turn-helix (wHTH) protein/TolB-like protein